MKGSPYNLGSHVQFRYTSNDGTVQSGIGRVVQIRPHETEKNEYWHKVKAIGGIYHTCLMRELSRYSFT